MGCENSTPKLAFYEQLDCWDYSVIHLNLKNQRRETKT